MRSILFLLSLTSAQASESMDEVVRARSHSLTVCYALDEVPRKGQVALEVQPAGDVSSVTLDDSLPVQVVECLRQRLRAWKFPAFSGEPRHVGWLLIMVGGSR